MKNRLLDILLENYGKPIMRLNSHGRWVKTTINDTYIDLIQEFPEDYRMNVSQIV